MNAKMNIQLIALCLLTAGTAMTKENRGNGREAPTAADFVKRLDKDNDGKVSKSEFDGPAEHFSRLDKNSDGYISKDEAPAGPPPGGQQVGGQQGGPQGGGPQGQQSQSASSATDFVTRLDKDNDGKVSSSEFDGPTEHFSQLDKNSDGYISEDEAPTGPPPRQQR